MTIGNFAHSLEEIANKKGVSMAQTALAWSMQKDGKIVHVVDYNIYSSRHAAVTAQIIGTILLDNLKELLDN